MDDLIHIGHLIKAFGKDGTMKMALLEPMKKHPFPVGYMIIEVDGQMLPYFVESIDPESDWVKFDEITSPEDARLVSDKKIFVRRSDLTKTIQNELQKKDFQSLKGWRVKDQNGQDIGTILSVDILPMHILLQIQYRDKKFWVPFHEELIISIIEPEKVLQLDIADGLMGLNQEC